MEWLLWIVIGLALGFLGGFFFRKVQIDRTLGSVEELSSKIREEAQKEAADKAKQR